MVLAIILSMLWAGPAKPPKYWEGLPLRSCMLWPDGDVCCGWFGGGSGLVTCYLGERWVVMADGRD
jgi:hypothetical protein